MDWFKLLQMERWGRSGLLPITFTRPCSFPRDSYSPKSCKENRELYHRTEQVTKEQHPQLPVSGKEGQHRTSASEKRNGTIPDKMFEGTLSMKQF